MPWIRISPTSGSLSAGQSVALTIVLDPAGLSPGTYDSAITILSPSAFYEVQMFSTKLFLAPSVVSTSSQVRVYPNPWRKDHSTQKLVAFDHMTPQSTIKIFGVSGHLIKTLTADSNGVASRDLTTQDGATAASGIYLYLIDAPDGSTSKGKLAIVHSSDQAGTLDGSLTLSEIRVEKGIFKVQT